MHALTFPRRVALLRIAFGVIWAIDAGFKWRPSFVDGFRDDIRAAADGQPGWILWWFRFWRRVLDSDPRAFAYATAVVETLIAACLLLGLLRAGSYLAGALFGLVIWSVAEGFGGPYTAGSTDIGTAIVYSVVFLALYGLDTAAGPPAFALDSRISRRFGWWTAIADPRLPPPGRSSA
jgi:thiosulfate dehydrogenase (quinone) large subunit